MKRNINNFDFSQNRKFFYYTNMYDRHFQWAIILITSSCRKVMFVIFGRYDTWNANIGACLIDLSMRYNTIFIGWDFEFSDSDFRFLFLHILDFQIILSDSQISDSDSQISDLFTDYHISFIYWDFEETKNNNLSLWFFLFKTRFDVKRRGFALRILSNN